MTNYWISWVATDKTGPWTLHSPWWISGARLKYDQDGEVYDEPTARRRLDAVL